MDSATGPSRGSRGAAIRENAASPARRAALVARARERDAVIVEDDYDAEYRYDREPVGALQGLAPEQVVYAGSVSKTLAPALRLGWIVPPALVMGCANLSEREIEEGIAGLRRI